MYTVTWTRTAKKELGEVMTSSNLDTALLEAFGLFRKEVATRPLKIGKERSSSVHRIVFINSLAVEYEVIEDDKRVIIHSVFLLPAP